MKRTYHKLVLVVFLATTPLSLAADRERVNEMSQKLMCTCGGCNTTLGFCPHGVTCHNAVPMKAELVKMMDEGKDDATILAAFADKYGATVLSTPSTSGFNLIAWIMPFAALAFGMAMTIYLVRSWKRTTPDTAPVAAQPKYQEEIEEALKKYTPED